MQTNAKVVLIHNTPTSPEQWNSWSRLTLFTSRGLSRDKNTGMIKTRVKCCSEFKL